MISRTTRKAIRNTHTRIVLFKRSERCWNNEDWGPEMSGKGEWGGGELMICSYFIPGGISGSECWQGAGNPGSAWMECWCSGEENPAEFLVVSWGWTGETKLEPQGARNTQAVFSSGQLLNSEAPWLGGSRQIRKLLKQEECSAVLVQRRSRLESRTCFREFGGVGAWCQQGHTS